MTPEWSYREPVWQRWFAWRPVVTNTGWAWLRTVERTLTQIHPYKDSDIGKLHYVYRKDGRGQEVRRVLP